MPAEDVQKEILRLKKRTRTSFVVDTTRYMERAGRIPRAVHILCETCMLHPVIVLRNSAMKVGKIRIGTRDAVWRRYIRSTLKNKSEIDTRLLFITHVGLTQEELTKIEQQVRERVPFETIVRQKASPAISVNCGPGTFGLLFLRKE